MMLNPVSANSVKDNQWTQLLVGGAAVPVGGLALGRVNHVHDAVLDQ